MAILPPELCSLGQGWVESSLAWLLPLSKPASFPTFWSATHSRNDLNTKPSSWSIFRKTQHATVALVPASVPFSKDLMRWFSKLYLKIAMLSSIYLYKSSIEPPCSSHHKKKKIRLQCRRPGFAFWFGMIPWRREWQPIPVFLPGKSHGQRSLAGYSPWVSKSQTLLNDWHVHIVNLQLSHLAWTLRIQTVKADRLGLESQLYDQDKVILTYFISALSSVNWR